MDELFTEIYMCAKLLAWTEEHHENFVSWIDAFTVIWILWV
jgi:hypothetical protein